MSSADMTTSSGLVGQTIRGYEVREHIGGGGFGDIYRAHQSMLKREVALKIIRPEYANHPEFIRRFEAEAQMVARLEHLHIVPLHDYWREPGGAYLVMRWLRGGSLGDMLKQGGLPVEETSHYLDQIASALSAAHRQGVVHRDLKPDNILLDEDGNTYLADFGIAKDLQSEGMTRASAIIGSPDYISPEQIEGGAITARTDIYALGIMLYEMLTGTKPFSGSTLTMLIQKHLMEPVPSVLEKRPDVPERIDDIIQRATAKNPDERYGDAIAVATAFRQAASLDATFSSAGSSSIGTRDYSAGAPVRAASLTGGLLRNPFKGLKAFQTADAADFYGRDALIEKLLGRLRPDATDEDINGRFLAVVGPSGSGKSSVVKAGLIPALNSGALPGSENWYMREMTPGAYPMEQLEMTLLGIAADSSEPLIDILRSGTDGLLKAVDRVLPDSDSQLLLVVDQFEELFTQLEDENERSFFLDSLLTAVQHDDSRLVVIITLRADFYDRPLLYSDFGLLFRDNAEVVLPLSNNELREAITVPAENAGLLLEPGLVEAIIADVGDRPGALPLLQYALTELYERREGHYLTLAAYESAGRAMGALARRANQVYDELPASEQDATRQIFLRLVVPGEGEEDTRRRVRREELLSLLEDETVIQNAIDAFGRYRLLTFDVDPVTRAPTVEVAHEALIRSWDRLRAWLTASRDDVRMQRLLLGKSDEWRYNNFDPSFLIFGAQLDLFEDWLQETDLALSEEERSYLDASIAERRRQDEDERQQAAYQEQLKMRALNRARIAIGVLVVGVIVAVGLSAFAFNSEQQAQAARATSVVDAATAAAAQITSEYNAVIALDQAGTAEAARATALHNEQQAQSARATSIADAAIAVAAQATADYNAAVAATQANIADGNARQAQSMALVGAANRALFQGDPDNALAFALIANDADETNSLARRAIFDAASSSWVQNRLTGHTDWIWDVTYSADGRYALSGSADKRVLLWDMNTMTIIREMTGHTEAVRSVALSADGRTALSGSYDGTVIYWSTTTGEAIFTFTADNADNTNDTTAGKTASSEIWDVAFTPDGTLALAGSSNGYLIIWDLRTGAEINRIDTGSAIVSLAVSPDGTQVLAGLNNFNAQLIDISNGDNVRMLYGHTLDIWSVAFLPDGARAITGSYDTTLILWDVTTGDILRTFRGHSDAVLGVAISKDGKRMLSSSNDSTVILWDIETGAILRVFDGHSGPAINVAFHPDGRQALSSSTDKTLILWDLRFDSLLRTYHGHLAEVSQIAIAADHTTMISSSYDGTLLVWDIESGRILKTLQEYDQIVQRAVSISADARLAASGTSDSLVLIWDVTSGTLRHRLTGHSDIVNSVAFNADHSRLLSAASDRTIILWDTESGAEIRRYSENDSNVIAALFHADGDHIVSGAQDGRIQIINIESGAVIRTIDTGRQLATIALNADGSRLLAGYGDNMVQLWDTATGSLLQTMEGHTGWINNVAFHPNGTLAISASDDRTLILWDTTTGRPLHRFQGHSNRANAVAISSDGRYAISSSDDTTLMRWDIVNYPAEILEWVYVNRAVPELTCEQRALYGVQPACDESGIYATRTPFPVPAMTATPVIIAATAAPVSNIADLPQYVRDGLAAVRVPLSSGYLAESIDNVVVDWSDRANLLDTHYIGGNHSNTVIGTTIQWGAAADTSCSIAYRQSDYNDLYRLQLSRNGKILLSDSRDGIWQPDRAIDGYALRTGETDSNELILVISEDQTSIFLNGEYIDQIRDRNHIAGRILLETLSTTSTGQASSAAQDGLNGCTFVNSWVWDTAYETITVGAPPPPASIVSALQAASIEETSGALVDRLREVRIDLSADNDTIRWEEMNGRYGNFVAGTTIEWGPGALNDYCGIRFHNQNDSDYYLISIDQAGSLLLDNMIAGQWQSPESLPSPTTRTGSGVTNQLMLVAVGDVFSVYINDELAGQFRGGTHTFGEIHLVGGTYTDSDDTWCTFTDSWIWELAPGFISPIPAPTAVPTPSPVATSISPSEQDIDSAIIDALTLANVDSGTLADEIETVRVDISDSDNQMRWFDFDGEYQNFVVGASITWGPGAAEDECGIIFHHNADATDFRTLQTDRLGNLILRTSIGDDLADEQVLPYAGINTAENATNQLLVVVSNDTTSVYINGVLAEQFYDTPLAAGTVALLGTTYTSSNETWCDFDNSWLWNLDNRQPLVIQPGATPSTMTIDAGMVHDALAVAGLSPESGYIAGEQLNKVVDLTGEDDLLSWSNFDGLYGDFAVGATIAWGPGAPDDSCGFIFRSSGEGNFYTVNIDQAGNTWFDRQFGGQWGDAISGENQAVNAGVDASNTLLLVAQGDTFTVYVNGINAGEMQDSTLKTGNVALLGATYTNSDETWCTFTDAWVWNLNP